MNNQILNEKTYCCKGMRDVLTGEDEIIVYIPRYRGYGIPVPDGGSSFITISHCPWCGTRLPDNLSDIYFQELNALGFYAEDVVEGRTPKQYLSDQWWRERGW